MQRYAQRTAFVSAGERISFAEVDRLSRDFCAWLQNVAGVKRGDRIAIMLPNILAFPIASLGMLRAGAVQVNVNPLYTARELEHQLNDSGCELIVAHCDLLFLQYTGGTTGLSKGAALSHRNLVANTEQYKAMVSAVTRPGEEVLVTALPLYHVFALMVNFITYFSFVAAILRATTERWMRITGTFIREGYGLSETSPRATYHSIYLSRHEHGHDGARYPMNDPARMSEVDRRSVTFRPTDRGHQPLPRLPRADRPARDAIATTGPRRRLL